MFARMTTTRAKWLERVQQWQQSGVSAAQFAQGKGYQPSTLIWYRTQLRREGLLQDSTLAAGSGGGQQAKASSSPKTKAEGGKKVLQSATKKAASRAMQGVVPLQFARVIRHAATLPQIDTMVVEVGLARISIRAGFNTGLLQQVVQALAGAA